MRSGDESLSRIAITSNTLDAGGAEMQRVLLANELVRRGISVDLYCLQALGPLANDLDPRVCVTVRDYWRGLGRSADATIAGTTNTEVAFAVKSRLTRRTSRWITVVHNPIGVGAPPLAPFARRFIEASDLVAALSRWHAEALVSQWHLHTDCLVPNGIDTGWATAVREARSAIARGSGFEFDLGFIGRLSMRHKGLDRLLLTLSRHEASEFSLAIAGDGPDRSALVEMADRLGIGDRVTFVGHQVAPEFLQRVRALAVFSRYEAQPMVILEARAAGVPVAASPASGADAAPHTVVFSEPATKDGPARALRAAVADDAVAAALLADLPLSVAEMTDGYVAALRAGANRTFAQRSRAVVRPGTRT